MGSDEFDYLDEPESYRTAMAQFLGGKPEDFSESCYRKLDEDEQAKIDELVQMNDIIGNQAGGLAGMQDLNEANELLEEASD